MKLNVFLTIISAAIAGLSAFGFFMTNEGDIYRVIITVGAGVSLFVTLGGMFALSSPNRGSIMNVRIVSGLFFIALLAEHIIFSYIGIRFAPYILITGILVLVYLLICYAIIRALKHQ